MIPGYRRVSNDPGKTQSSASSFTEIEQTMSTETTALLDGSGGSVTPQYGSAEPPDLGERFAITFWGVFGSSMPSGVED